MADSHPRKDFVIPLLTVLSDVVTIEASFLFSYWFRFDSSFTFLFPVEYGIPQLNAYIFGSFVVIPIWLWLFQSRRLYQPRRITSFSDEFFAVVRIVSLGMLVVMAIAFFYRAFSYSRLVFAIIGLTAIILVSIGRFVLLKFEQRWYQAGKDVKQVLLIGTNSIASKVYHSIQSNRSLGYNVIGFCSPENMNSASMDGIPYLGTVKDVPQLINERAIDVVLISLGDTEHALLPDLVQSCQGLNAEMMMVPDILELMTSHVHIKHIEGIPFLGIKSPSLSTWNSIVKRTFDIVFATTVLILISPLLLLLASVIKLESKGPILFLQDRVGLDGKLFKVMKFRSMHENAEKHSGPVWAQKHDPRTTKLGKVMRRFSIDELPQLFNVLKGDMSIVGPRPERPFFVEQFKKEVPRYLERHRVKTGMTGWAQVNGMRGREATIADRTKYDIYYVENWSLVFDLKIIFKTIRAVFFGEDAY